MAEKNEMTVATAPREVIISRVINAPRGLVFDAFTKAEHLARWFAPDGFRCTAETDPRVGGIYRITMHGTPGDSKGSRDAPPEPYANEDLPMFGEYLEFARPERLVYTSNMEAHPESWKELIRSNIENPHEANFLLATTAITFDDLGGKTKLTIHAKFETDAIRDAYSKTGMEEGWRQILERLDTFLKPESNKTVVVERIYKAPIEQVWDAITNNDAMNQWFFKLPEFRPEVGFEFEFGGGPPERTYLHKCKVVEVIPQKKLAYSWCYDGYEGNSIVTIELSPEGNGTKLRLTHSELDTFGVNNNHDFDAHNFADGWNSIIGTSLKKYLEG